MSLIEDFDLIQGDSSPLFYFGLPDGSSLDDVNWSAEFAILTDYGTSPIVTRALPLNSGTGAGDTYTAGTKFVFQVTPSESATLTVGTKYIVAVEISNGTIPYKGEVAQFKMKVKPQGVV